jgi:glycine reductase
VAIPHPVGEPAKGPEADKKARRELLMRALEAMTTSISEQTIFERK